MPFDDGSFDLIVLIEVIEHVQDKRALLSEIARVLRPKGRLLLTTPNHDCWASRVERTMWRLFRTVLGKRQVLRDIHIDATTLQKHLRAEGFRILNQNALYSWPRAFIHFQRWSLMPPLPPSLLMPYQRLWIKVLSDRELTLFLERRLMWTINVYAELQ